MQEFSKFTHETAEVKYLKKINKYIVTFIYC